MPSGFLLLPMIIGIVIATAILLYGAYWAFAIRRALFVRSYRAQALWIGFFCLFEIYQVTLLGNYLASLNNPFANWANGLYYLFLGVLLFRLVDVDVGVARRSDPLLRETLHWRKLRLVVWSLMGFSIVALNLWEVGVDFLGYAPPSWLLSILRAFFIIPFVVSGTPALLIAASRSKDETFRRSLKWFGFFFVLVLIQAVAFLTTSSGLLSVSQDYFNAGAVVLFAPSAYCLYRSAKSLAPLDRITSL